MVVLLWFSAVYFVSEFRWYFILCLFKLFQVGFSLLSGRLFGKSWMTIYSLYILTIFILVKFRFGLGSDCPSSWSLLTCSFSHDKAYFKTEIPI